MLFFFIYQFFVCIQFYIEVLLFFIIRGIILIYLNKKCYFQRLRKIGVRFIGDDIVLDEYIIFNFSFDYEGKRDYVVGVDVEDYQMKVRGEYS